MGPWLRTPVLVANRTLLASVFILVLVAVPAVPLASEMVVDRIFFILNLRILEKVKSSKVFNRKWELKLTCWWVKRALYAISLLTGTRFRASP